LDYIALADKYNKLRFKSTTTNQVYISGNAANMIGVSSGFQINQSLDDSITNFFSGKAKFTVNGKEFSYDFSSATDNGTGVAILLTLADLLKDYTENLGIELLVLNGEDYYAASGEMLYLDQYQHTFDDIMLAVNMDGAGVCRCRTGVTSFGCEGSLARIINEVFSDREKFVELPPWYQSDHSLFLMKQVPALAITTEDNGYWLAEIVHTSYDTIDGVEIKKLAEVAAALQNLINGLNQGKIY
jgi:Zn-dependent M28 family amino/carboxypeptidase